MRGLLVQRKQLLWALSQGAMKTPCLSRIDSGFSVFSLSSGVGSAEERNPDIHFLINFEAPLLY